MSGKRYPEEFKTEAVKQVVDRGYSVASVATRLDITTHSLYAGCGVNALSCLQKHANSIYCRDGVGLISVAHQAFLRLPSVSNPRQ